MFTILAVSDGHAHTGRKFRFERPGAAFPSPVRVPPTSHKAGFSRIVSESVPAAMRRSRRQTMATAGGVCFRLFSSRAADCMIQPATHADKPGRACPFLPWAPAHLFWQPCCAGSGVFSALGIHPPPRRQNDPPDLFPKGRAYGDEARGRAAAWRHRLRTAFAQSVRPGAACIVRSRPADSAGRVFHVEHLLGSSVNKPRPCAQLLSERHEPHSQAPRKASLSRCNSPAVSFVRRTASPCAGTSRTSCISASRSSESAVAAKSPW